MTTAQKRMSFRNRIGQIFGGGQTIQRSGGPPANHYSDAQRSYLVDCGCPNDASDDEVARFATALNDFERAELDLIGAEGNAPNDQVERSDDSGDTGGQSDGQSGASSGGNQEPIQRNHNPPLDPADVDGRIERALADRDAEDQRRNDLVRELAGDDIPQEVITRALTERWPETRITREFLAAARNRPAPVGRAPAGHVTGSDQRNTLQALQGGLLLREGIALDDGIFRSQQARAMLGRRECNAGWLHTLASDGIVRGGDDTTQRDTILRARDNAHEFADMHLVDFCRVALQMSHRQVPRDYEGIVRAAMSTATLQAVFSTSVNMQILQAYMAKPDTTQGWTFETDVNGFHVQKRGRLTKGKGVRKLARGGTPEDITFSDETENYAAERYAGRFIIDEQDIMDNVLGGIQEHTTRELGELLAEIKINLIYGLLLKNPTMRDGKTLFHADHNNTGTGLAWALESYRQVRAAMGKQTENGRHIESSLAHVIAPEELDFPVRQLLSSAELRNADSTAGAQGTKNPATNTATPHFDARLDVGVENPEDETFYSGSTTTWFGAANNGRHGIEVGYRRGSGRAPRIEGGVLPVTEGYGLVYRGNIDLGVKAIDWLGLYRSQE